MSYKIQIMRGDASPLNVLAQFRASRDLIVQHDEVQLFLALFRADGGKQHTVALQTHHLPGRQIHDGGQSFAYQFLRLIELVDTGEDLSVPVPSSSVKRSSLSDFFTASQALTFTTRKSDLQKVSKSTVSVS